MTDKSLLPDTVLDRTEYATVEDWQVEAVRRFGADPMQWRFVCPSCGYEAAVHEWKDAGAPQTTVAFSCVGRYMKPTPSEAFKQDGGPCNYAGGGLIGLNPVKIGEREGRVFQFAAAPQGGEE